MKTRILLSTLLLVALLTSLALPAMAQGPVVDVVEPAPEKALPEGKGLPEYPGLPHQAGIAGVATDYVWSQTLGTYTEITGGTQLTTSCDDTNYNANPIPFTFTFDGADYTQFSLNCNGFIAMGATVVSSYTPISSGTSNNVIVALGGDQQTNTTDSEIRYETLGTSPDQVLVIQWKNFRHYAATGDLYNYQIRLYETSNLVEVVYGPFTQNATARTAQVGLRGASSADFNSRTSTAEWTNSSASVLNTETMALTSTYFPPSGLTWDWSIIVGPNLSQSTKAAPGKVVFGQPIEYTIEILNTGLAPAAGATLVDPIPAGTVYNNDVACSSGQCWFDSGTVYWAGQVATPPKATSFVPAKVSGGGANAAITASSPAGALVAPEGTANPEDVLWDQPLSSVNQNAYVNQDFTDLPTYSSFLADDFVNGEAWDIDTIFVPGNGWNGFATLFNATGLTWQIYADNGGVPDGDPSGAGNPPVWTMTLPPTDAQVTITNGSGGMPSNTLLNLAAPVSVPPGTWWLVFYPSLPFSGGGQFGRQPADTSNGYYGQFVNPGGAFGYGAAWQSWAVIGAPQQDIAFRLEGTAGEQPPENPVTVTFSVTPENPECGMIVVNEAVIDDPEIPAPVVVQASTEVWQMVLLHEDFGGDVFPPVGWVEAHDAAGMAWTDQDLEPRGNLTGGTGKFAIVDDDYGGSAALTTAQLWTPPFDIPAGGYATQLLFKTDYNNISTSESADVDISLDNGATWTNLLHWNTDHRGPLTQSVDLTPFAGATGAILRFYYYDGAAYAWWWEIDDVQVVSCYAAAPEIDVSPLELSQTLCPDATAAQTLTICNLGDAPLTWELTEIEPLKGVQTVLYDNGPLVTHPGGGYNAADASVLQTALGLNTYGFGNQYLNGYRMADDFAVTDPGGWNIQQVTFFAYQTGTYGFPPVSTITGLYFQIWDGPPNDPGSAVVFGDLVTNRLASTSWPGMYRVLDTDMLNAQRPPMANVGTAGVVLPPGTYWLDWMTDGSGASGPWAPPISIVGETTTGNALQYTTAWAAALDTGLSTPQGMPFIVEGEVAGPPPDLTWLSEDPLAGTVDPGTCQDVTVTFDSTGLVPGTYTGWLRIASNDADEGQIDVPVTLTVEACGENQMHIGNITFSTALDPYGRTLARWNVLTHDQGHLPLGEVVVDASIWSPAGGPYARTRITKFSGWARFHWGYRTSGTFLLCVDDLTKTGYTYLPGANDVPNCAP